MDIEKVWLKILENEGKNITLKSGDVFKYRVSGGSVFIDNKNWKITKQMISSAIDYKNDASQNDNPTAKLSYIYAILKSIV